LTEINPHSPVKMMREVINVREEVFKQKYKGKAIGEMTNKVIADIKSKVRLPNKSDWGSFVKSIEC